VAWSLVQQSAAQTANGTNTLPAPSTAGNLLVAVVSSASAVALTAPAGWAAGLTVANVGTTTELTVFWYLNNPGGLSSFTFGGGSGTNQVVVGEFTCPNVALLAGPSATGTGTAGAVASVTVTTGTTAVAGDLVVGSAYEHLSSTSTITWTNPAGFTPFPGLLVGNTFNHCYAGYLLAAASNGAQSVTPTSSVTATGAQGWCGAVVTFSQPVIAPEQQFPAQSRQPLPPRGRTASNPGAPVRNPVAGPVFRPATAPIRAHIPQTFSAGRADGNPGAPVRNPVTGPIFRLPRQPARTRIPQTFSSGRTSGDPGAPVTPPPSPSWALVQQSAAQTTDGTNTLPAPTTAGNLLVAVVGSPSPVPITADTGWIRATHVADNTSNETYLWYYPNNPGGLSSFTFGGGSGVNQVVVAEFTCPAVTSVTSPTDIGAGNDGAVASLTVSTTGAALPGDLVIVGVSEHLTSQTAITWTDPDDSWAEFAGLQTGAAFNHCYAAYQMAAPAGGVQSVTVTSSVTADGPQGWTGVVATFTDPGVRITNSAEGGPTGSTASAANSGGPSGTAWDTVFIGTSGAITYDGAHPAHGTTSYKVSTGGSAVAVYGQWGPALTGVGTAPQVWFRSYLYFAANPVANVRVAAVLNSNTQCAAVYVTTTGAVQVANSANTAVITTTNTIPLNAWCRIEGFVIGSSTAGQVEIKLYKVKDSPTATETVTSTAAQNTLSAINQIRFGSIGTTANVVSFWMDDLGASTSGYLGPVVGCPPPLRQPARARIPKTWAKGRAGSGNKGAPVRNPVAGPVFRQRNRPARYRISQPPRGRASGSPGAPVRSPVTLAVFRQDTGPARACIPQTFIAGRTSGDAGAPVRNPAAGPVFRQATQPARARVPQTFSSGRTSGDPGAPVRNATAGPTFRQATAPARGRVPKTFSVGRASGDPGAPTQNPVAGPALRPLVAPARARIPQASAGGRATSTPAAAPAATAWSLVQQSTAQTGNSTNTLPAPSTAGNLLVAVAGCAVNTAITGPSGWIQGPVAVNGITNQVSLWYYPDNPGGLSSFTFGGGSGTNSVTVGEFTRAGVAAVTTTSDTGTGTAGAVTAVTVTTGGTTQPGDLVITGSFEHLSGAQAITWTDPTGFTEFAGLRISSLQNHCYAAFSLAAPTGGVQSVTVTSSVASTLAAGWTGVVATFGQPPATGPAFRQATQPARARVPQTWSKGRGYAGNPGAPVRNPSTGPKFYPLVAPARARVPQTFSTGRTNGDSGGPVRNPAGAFYPLTHPARAPLPPRLRALPPRGLPGAPVRNPAAGPAFYPLLAPARARLPQPHPRAGRTSGSTGAPRNNPTAGPVFRLPPQTVRAVIPARVRALPPLGSRGAPVRNPTAGPTVRPLTGPVQAKRPLFLLGRSDSLPGAPLRNPTAGPAVKAPPGPARAHVQPPFSKGRASGNPGAPAVQAGPKFSPLTHPARAPVPNRVRALAPAGSKGAPVRNPVQGPTFYPLVAPARARLPQLAPRAGRAAGSPGAAVRNPTAGPVAKPLTATVRAHTVPPFTAGRTSTDPGAPVVNPAGPPVFRPLPFPVRAHIPQTFSAGRADGNPGAPVRNPTAGPAVKPLAGPIRAKRPLFRLGRAQALPGAPPANPVSGPAVKPLAGPARARIPQVFSAGRTNSDPGAPVHNPVAPFYLLNRPARAPLPARVRAPAPLGNRGAPLRNPTTGPPVTGQQRPAQARRPLPPRGRTLGNPGAPVQNPPPGGGPAFYPARQPARIRVTLPPRGRSAGGRGAPRNNPVAGPPVKPLTSPVRAHVPQAWSKGHAAGSPGAPVTNPTAGPVFRQAVQPARTRTQPPFSKGRTSAGKGAPVRNPAAPFHAAPSPTQARLPQLHPRAGRATGNTGAPLRNPVAGPVFRQATRPAQARIPRTFSKGRSGWNAGAPLANPVAGPRTYPLEGPVRGRLPQLHPRAGRTYGNVGAPARNATAGPVFRQATAPARGRVPQTWAKGHATGNIGAPVANPAAAQLHQLRKAVHAQPPVFLKGRIASSPGAPHANPTTGPRFYPLNHPAGLAHRAPGPFRKGSTQGHYGFFVASLPHLSPAQVTITPTGASAATITVTPAVTTVFAVAPTGAQAATLTLTPASPTVLTVAPTGAQAAVLTASSPSRPGQRPVTWAPAPPLPTHPSPPAAITSSA
jgi:hypothetical protein